MEPPGITNGKTLLLSSLVFVYVQFVHRRYVLIVYCKQLLKGAQNMASASKNSEASLLDQHSHLLNFETPVVCLQKMVLEVVSEQICRKEGPALLDQHSHLLNFETPDTCYWPHDTNVPCISNRPVLK